tara:strand:- start:186 stop:344 length:159 start_codon:yes stop_codon:yes gene_type:complete
VFLLRLKIHTKKHIYAKSAARTLVLAIAATRVGSGALKTVFVGTLQKWKYYE